MWWLKTESLSQGHRTLKGQKPASLQYACRTHTIPTLSYKDMYNKDFLPISRSSWVYLVTSEIRHLVFLLVLSQQTPNYCLLWRGNRFESEDTPHTDQARGLHTPGFTVFSPLLDITSSTAVQRGTKMILRWRLIVFSTGLLFSAWWWCFLQKCLLSVSCCCSCFIE